MRTQESGSGPDTFRPPKLAGRYIVTRMLGKGAQARVYLAHDTRLKQWRAIKVLASNYLEDEHVRSRFEAEAQVMARMSHPNLMRVVDVDRDGRVPFMVMELARGGSALDWCKRHGPMPPRLALDVAMQCAEGLQCAHELGIVHRDVKPHNILIREDRRVVLTDFGIAQIAEGEHLTATGAAMGTFVFMAPEQRSDAKSVDNRADVYGLGATLFTLLTLRTSAELFFAEARDDLLDGIPDNLQPVILAACKYEREQRYPSMKAFRDALAYRMGQFGAADLPNLVDEVVKIPEEMPKSVGREALIDDLIAILGAGGSTRPVSLAPASGRTDPPNERSFEEMPTVMPYRMPGRAELLRTRTGTTNSSELRQEIPDYVDQSTLPVARIAETPAPPPPPPLEVVESSEVSPLNRVAFAVVGASVLLVLLVLGAGLVQKSAASSARATAGKELVREADAYQTLADELARQGADGDQLRKLYFGFQDAKGATQVPAAIAFVQKAVEETDRVHPNGIAETQVRQLRHALDEYRVAEERWKAAQASRLGRLTGQVGLY